MGKKRVNWTIDNESIKLLKMATKISKKSVSLIADECIKKQLSDPVKSLKEQKKRLIIEINQIDAKLEEIEKNRW